MIEKVFILVPSFAATGPVKGAVALANALAEKCAVTLTALKGSERRDSSLDPRVEIRGLAQQGPMVKRVLAYRAALKRAGGRKQIASISLCLSADLVNAMCRRYAVTCASVRGNLVVNYRMDYGWPGAPLAAAHLAALRGVDHVVAMTESMAVQVRHYSGKEPAVIGNFVEERALDPYRFDGERGGPLRFVFVGSLTIRKQPKLVLTAIRKLREQGIQAQLDVIGEGPLRGELEAAVRRWQLGPWVRFHGFLHEPYSIVAKADTLVLPSISEGISRAALEALHLGVPCVMRRADGNEELIRLDRNGELFDREEDLSEVMHRVATWSRARRGPSNTLLPGPFRQQRGADQYLRILKG